VPCPRLQIALLVSALVAAAVGVACVHAPPPAPALAAPAASAEPAVLPSARLATLPVESDQFPEVATELNAAMREAHAPGIEEVFASKVTLEVAQLSVECVEPSPSCWAAVGHAMAAGRMLLARIEASHEPDRALRVRLTLFDVDGARPIRVVDRGYKTVADASRRVRKQVEHVLEALGATPTKDTAEPESAAEEAK
jgi:hypothetical protein